jgi:hypothetical protein
MEAVGEIARRIENRFWYGMIAGAVDMAPTAAAVPESAKVNIIDLVQAYIIQIQHNRDLLGTRCDSLEKWLFL